MKILSALSTVLVFSLGGSFAFAKCVIPVDQIEQVAANLKWKNDQGEEKNTAVVRFDMQPVFVRGNSENIIDYEAFIRPDRDDAFQILPIPLFMVQLEKKRDTIYICAHLETANPSKNLSVAYFLRYNQIRPITPMPLPLRQINNLLTGPLENTPFMVTGVPMKVLARAQSIFVHIFSDITKLGVDRILVTSNEIKLYSGGDLTRFEQKPLKIIPLK
jgi:hypothetical protein